MTLTLRCTYRDVENDYLVIDDGARIGRIRQAKERGGFNPGWDWNIQIHIPLYGRSGTSDTFEQAKADFCQRWQEVRNSISDEAFERAITEADGWVKPRG